MKTQFTVAIGQKVAYSVQFLRSIGESHGAMARGRGTVTFVKYYGDSVAIASIAWDKNADLPEKVNVQNLAKVGPNARFANCD